MDDNRKVTYIARLVGMDEIRQAIEFEAADDRTAWRHANEGVDPLVGLWVEVTRKPDPQQSPERQCSGDTDSHELLETEGVQAE